MLKVPLKDLTHPRDIVAFYEYIISAEFLKRLDYIGML